MLGGILFYYIFLFILLFSSFTYFFTGEKIKVFVDGLVREKYKLKFIISHFLSSLLFPSPYLSLFYFLITHSSLVLKKGRLFNLDLKKVV